MPWALSAATGIIPLRQPCEWRLLYGLHRRQRLNAKSLGLTLNRVVDNKPQYQDNFVTLANRAGFQTWWFSNQGQIGEYDTAIASIAKRADEAHFLKNGDFEADKNTRDDALLTMTAQVLATERTQPQLIVLHLMGSHPGPATVLMENTRRLSSRKRRLVIYTP